MTVETEKPIASNHSPISVAAAIISAQSRTSRSPGFFGRIFFTRGYAAVWFLRSGIT